MDAAEKDKAVRWLNEKGATRACIACGHNRLELADHVAYLTTMLPGFFGGGANFPLLVLACERCSNFRFHSAINAGIIPHNPPPPLTPSSGPPPSPSDVEGA